MSEFPEHSLKVDPGGKREMLARHFPGLSDDDIEIVIEQARDRGCGVLWLAKQWYYPPEAPHV